MYSKTFQQFFMYQMCFGLFERQCFKKQHYQGEHNQPDKTHKW